MERNDNQKDSFNNIVKVEEQSPNLNMKIKSEPSVDTIHASISKKKIKKSSEHPISKKMTGHWTKEEHDTYLNFLMQHKHQTLENQLNKKNNKIFTLMAQTIGTRSPSQCRSHHQKFNPFTPQGQKRGVKSRKRISIEEKEKNECEAQNLSRKIQYDDEEIQNEVAQEQQQTSIQQIGTFFQEQFIPTPLIQYPQYPEYNFQADQIPYYFPHQPEQAQVHQIFEMNSYLHEIIPQQHRFRTVSEELE